MANAPLTEKQDACTCGAVPNPTCPVDWPDIPLHCAECGAQFLRKVKSQKYCDQHRHQAGIRIKLLVETCEYPSSNGWPDE